MTLKLVVDISLEEKFISRALIPSSFTKKSQSSGNHITENTVSSPRHYSQEITVSTIKCKLL
jgi:hypothetical protein